MFQRKHFVHIRPPSRLSPFLVHQQSLFTKKESHQPRLRAVRHAATIENLEVKWEIMPKPLGSDTPIWLDHVEQQKA